MKINRYVRGGFILTTALLLAAGCKDDNPGPAPLPAGDARQERNAFAQLLMTDFYLWNREAQNTIVTQGLDYLSADDPIAFFKEMIYEDDEWSLMTDNFASVQGEVSGTTTTFGYEQKFWLYDGSGTDVFSIVQYVYPGTPAAAAGIGRGDLIVGINGNALTMDNYTEFLYASNIELEMGRYNPETNEIEYTGETIALTAVEAYLDPIQHHAVLEEHGRRIGYLCYTQYICDPSRDAHSELLRVFEGFRAAGVEEVVLDLRYNRGGYAVTDELLCDILAPRSALDNGEIMTVERWNDKYADFNAATTFAHEVKYQWTDKKTYTDRVINLDLDRVYILTSEDTASASESTIVGLMPYMDVVQIGGTTSGKFCSGILVDRTIYNSTKNLASLENWCAYVMINRFTNKLGTLFAGGFAPLPQNEAAEDLIRAPYPFGDTRDPLLARALELITGEDYGAARAATRAAAPCPYTPLSPDRTPSASPLAGKRITRLPEGFLEVI